MITRTITFVLILAANFIYADAAIPLPPFIFNYSESALPGETISLQGHAFGTAPVVWLTIVKEGSRILQPQIKLSSITASDTYIATKIPESASEGLFAVWIENNKQFSKPIFINRARAVTAEYNEIMPGTVFRLFGKNLALTNGSSQAAFISTSNGTVLPAIVLKSDAFEMQLKAPANLAAGQAYRLRISNGNGGKYGESFFEEAIAIRKTASDDFHFNVPWAADFDFGSNIYNVKTDARLALKAKGDGTANDRAAIQAAIEQASVHGGVVYLPQGSYKLMYSTGSGLTMRSRVVLKGDGPEKTSITYGYGTPFSNERVKAPYGWTLGWPDSRAEGMGMIWPGGINTSALIDLNFKNVNESGNFLHTIKDMPEGGSKLAFKNCTFELSTGWGFAMVNVNQLLITGCVFKSTAMDVRNINASTRTWPWDLKNSNNLIFSNNKHFYTAGRFGANGCHHAIFENNSFIRDGNHQSKGETGGLSLDYISQVVVQSNSFEVSGAAIKNANQGETILSQGGNAHQQNMGVVSGATTTTLTDIKKEFQDLTDRVSTDWQYAVHPTNYSLVLVNGVGAGQWRTITGNNDTTLTIDKPWDIIPEPGSRYVITQWSAQKMLVRNNILKGNNRGIWFYSGLNDVVITGNKLINSEGIYVRADQRMTNNRYNLTWNALITDNQVIDNDGKRQAYIAIWMAKNKTENLFGTGTLGVEIRRNTIQAFIPNLIKGSLVNNEGYFNFGNETELKGTATDAGIAAILGTVFEKNKAINTDHPFQISSNAKQTVVDSHPAGTTKPQ